MKNTLKPATLAALPLDLACRLAAADLTHEQWLVVGFLCLQVGVRTSIAAALFGSDGSKQQNKAAREQLRCALAARGLYDRKVAKARNAR